MKTLNFHLLAASICLSPLTISADDNAEKTAPKKEAAEVKKPDQEIVIEGNDQMQFNKKELEIKVGETIKLTLKHSGKLPKEVMGHNFVLLAKGTNLVGWATQAMTARENDFIPTAPEAKEAILAHTKVLGGGESDSVTFSVKEAGEYEFLCSFPGHFGVMKGKVIVK